MTHICVSKLTIIGSDNGLSTGRRQAIIWTNAGILLIWTLGKNFSEILSEIPAFSFKKMHLKISSAKWRPFCLGLNVLTSSVDNTTGRRQPAIWTSAGMRLIWPLGIEFSEMLIEIHLFSFKKIHLNMSSAKMVAILSWPRCDIVCTNLHNSLITANRYHIDV